jgi:hypothetical protein
MEKTVLPASVLDKTKPLSVRNVLIVPVIVPPEARNIVSPSAVFSNHGRDIERTTTRLPIPEALYRCVPLGHVDCQVPAGTRTASTFGREERRTVFVTSVVETAERTAPPLL